MYFLVLSAERLRSNDTTVAMSTSSAWIMVLKFQFAIIETGAYGEEVDSMATVSESKNMLKQKGWKRTMGEGRAEELPVPKMKHLSNKIEY